MTLLFKNRLDIKLGDYAIGGAGSLTDAGLVSRAQDYRRHLASRMIPLEGGDIRRRLPAADYHVSLKIDGEFNMLVYAEGETLLVNPGGTVRVGLPLLKEAAGLLQKANVKRALLAGELYYQRPDGKRARVHDVSRVARQPDSLGDIDRLRFGVFDAVEIDGVIPSASFKPTWERLQGLFGSGRYCTVVEARWLADPADIDQQFRNYVEKGLEGVVVRSDAAGHFKVKPRHNLDAVVIGFTEGNEDRRGLIHDLLLALMRADGCFHVLGHVGGGFSQEERRAFLGDLKDTIVASDYLEVNDQVAYHMVRPEWVIEISVLEAISQSTSGSPINKMVLGWDAAAQRYRIIRRLPLVALISPQFIRRRDDKSVNPTDLRLQQITNLVEVGLVDRDARQLKLPSSQLLRRQVYTKQLKGQTMVRKLVLWQTNKDRDLEEFPAFVIHFTDYSPNRKTPLERDIRVSHSRDQIDALWQELAEENITKGWVPVGGEAPAPEAAPKKTGEEPPTVAVKPAATKRGRARKEEKPETGASPGPSAVEERKASVEPSGPKKKRSPGKKKGG